VSEMSSCRRMVSGVLGVCSRRKNLSTGLQFLFKGLHFDKILIKLGKMSFQNKQ
jgi:hypothetical protein